MQKGKAANGALAPQAAVPDRAASVDLSTWYSKDETCRILGIEERALNERIRRKNGTGPEKRERPRLPDPTTGRIVGPKDEPCYNPADVERLRPKQAPVAAVFSASSGVGPGRRQQDGDPAGMLAAVLEGIARIAARPAQRLRDPYLTLDQASKHSGMSPRLLGRLVRAGCVRAIRDHGIRILRSDLDALSPDVVAEHQDRMRAPQAALPAAAARRLLKAAQAATPFAAAVAPATTIEVVCQSSFQTK